MPSTTPRARFSYPWCGGAARRSGGEGVRQRCSVTSSRSRTTRCHRTRPPAATESPTRFRRHFLTDHDPRTCDLDCSRDRSCFFDGWFGRNAHARRRIAHNGMFPCLRCGSSSRLDLSISRPAMTFMRVSAGSMTSSMNPRSAATYGLANRSV